MIVKEVSDSRGVGLVIPFEKQEVLLFEIKAGKLRGGEVHSTEQFTACIYGVIEIMLKQKSKTNTTLLTVGEFIVIPSHTPHLFRALEDSVFVEWKPPISTTKYYQPYRKVVEDQFK